MSSLVIIRGSISLGVSLKTILSIALLTLSFSSYANYDCEAGGDPQLMSCSPADVPAPQANGCQGQEAPKVSENVEDIKEELKAQACEEQDIWKGMSQEEKDKKLKELNKLCKQEAKAYKKSVFKSLFKKGKFGQALQVVFKRKKNIMNGSTNTMKQDISGMDEAQVRQYLKDELARLGAKKKTDKGQQSFTVPFNMVINDGKGVSCSVKAKDFPTEPAYEKPDCVGCEPIDIMSSFTNDCSYMVDKSSGLTEEKVLKEILKVSASDRKQYCQPDMTKNQDKGNNDLTKINKLAQDLCKQIQNGEEPHLTVETSRNLYADKTPQLAYKRGVFVQKYIGWHLSKNCDLKGETFEKGFDSIVEVKLPKYGAADKNFEGWKEGDYGPNPYATSEADIKSEKDKFAQNLQREEAELKKEIADMDKQIADLKKQIADHDAQTATFQKNYQGAKKQLEAMKKYKQDLVDASENLLTTIGNQTMANYSEKQQLMKKKDILEQKRDIAKAKLASQASKSAEKKKLLDEFYAAGPNRDHAAWDEKLFNSFKMARITANPPATDDVELEPMQEFDPEIATMMKELMALQTYTCNLQPIETKRTTLEGVLKFPLKVASILTLPVLAVGGAAATVALAPINTAIGAFCRGCNEPGGTLPRFFAIGDVTQLDLSKSSRKQAWDATKGFIKNYVTWGGALNVNGKKHITKHHLDTYHPGWDKLSPEAQEDVIDKFFKKEFPEDMKEGDVGATRTPAAGCNTATVIPDKKADEKVKTSGGSGTKGARY